MGERRPGSDRRDVGRTNLQIRRAVDGGMETAESFVEEVNKKTRCQKFRGTYSRKSQVYRKRCVDIYEPSMHVNAAMPVKLRQRITDHRGPEFHLVEQNGRENVTKY